MSAARLGTALRLAAAAAACAAIASPAAASAPEWMISMWAGAAGAGDSEARTRQAGTPLSGSATDFSAFLLVGVRSELYFARTGPLSALGIGIEIAGLAGEADVETQPGLPSEEVTLTAGVLTPYLAFRFPACASRGCAWEFYAGAGPTLLWESRLSGAGSVFFDDDDTDAEAPLGLSAYVGARRSDPAGWFFMLEARRQNGRNDFDLHVPRTEVGIDWRTTQFVIGAGYRAGFSPGG